MVSSYLGCDAGHPTIALPTGNQELGAAGPGTLLGIYDLVMKVTSVRPGNGLSGTGLVRAPFLQNAWIPVEFEGLRAWRSTPDGAMGCVYAVGGYFRTRSVATAALAREQAALAASPTTDSTATRSVEGTLEQLLQRYDQQPDSLLARAIHQALDRWVAQVRAAYPASPALDSLLHQLDQARTALTDSTSTGPGGLEVRFKDLLQAFNAPLPPAQAAASATPAPRWEQGPTLAQLGACLTTTAPYNPLNPPCYSTGLRYSGTYAGQPYWTYTAPDGSRHFVAVTTAADGTPHYLTASDADWRGCGRPAATPCDNLWRPFAPLPGTPDSTRTNPLLPKLTPVVASALTTSGATLSWASHPSFARYVIRYRTSNGGELQQDVTAAQVSLLRLAEGSDYAYTIEAYDAQGQLADSYSGTFKTLSERLNPPQNLQVTVVDKGKVKITWDKDPAHQSYQLTYRTPTNEEKTLTLSASEAQIDGLDSLSVYSYTVTAFGKSAAGTELKSDPAASTFTLKPQEPCSQPLVLSATVHPDTKGFTIQWQPVAGQTAVLLRYRKVQSPEALWTSQLVTGENSYQIGSLMPKAQYEYRARAVCNTDTATQEAGGFITLTRQKVQPTISYQCGSGLLPPVTNKTPLDVPLEVGDYILMGGFPSQIDRLDTSSPPYKGIAHTLVPYLGMSTFLMEFDNLTVNTDYEALTGQMNSINDPVTLAAIKQQNAQRMQAQKEAVKVLFEEAKALAQEITGLYASGKPIPTEKYNTFIQQQNTIIAELQGTNPQVAAEIKAIQDELVAIYAKPEYQIASTNNDFRPTLSPEDQQKANTLGQKLEQLYQQEQEALAVPAQLIACFGAATLDMAMNYVFKWIEVNFLDDNAANNYSLADFRNLWAAADKWEIFSSAATACATTVLPLPTNKAKLIGTAVAAFAGGSQAMVAEAGRQYDELPENWDFQTKIQAINWEIVFQKAAIQSFIAGVATGVSLYAIDHPQFRNFASRIKNIGYEKVKYILKNSGFSDEAVESFCKRFGLSVAGSLLDNVYYIQKNIVTQWKNNIANATSIRKGNFGEIASDAFLAEKNFKALHIRLQDIDEPTRQGIDGVFKKGNDYFIVEAKYKGTATLSTLADGTKQMSDAWIIPRLLDAVNGNTSLRNEIANGYRRLLAEIAPDGTVIYKELDANASIIGIFIP